MLALVLATLFIGNLAIFVAGWNAFCVWPIVTIMVLTVNYSILDVQKVNAGMDVQRGQFLKRVLMILLMALLAEGIYTAYWLLGQGFHWVAQHEGIIR
jgi:hypothetical protein